MPCRVHFSIKLLGKLPKRVRDGVDGEFGNPDTAMIALAQQFVQCRRGRGGGWAEEFGKPDMVMILIEALWMNADIIILIICVQYPKSWCDICFSQSAICTTTVVFIFYIYTNIQTCICICIRDFSFHVICLPL